MRQVDAPTSKAHILSSYNGHRLAGASGREVLARSPSTQLVASIREAHHKVNNHPFFDALYSPTGLNKQQYLQHLADRVHVLDTLETNLNRFAEDPYCKPLLRSWLPRGAALAIDSQLLDLPIPPVSAAACLFAAQLNDFSLEANTPALAVHAWIQYMGMLSGGRAIAAKCAHKFGTARALTIENCPSATPRDYRRAIDAIPPPSAELMEALCGYANASFDATLSLLNTVVESSEGPA